MWVWSVSVSNWIKRRRFITNSVVCGCGGACIRLASYWLPSPAHNGVVLCRLEPLVYCPPCHVTKSRFLSRYRRRTRRGDVAAAGRLWRHGFMCSTGRENGWRGAVMGSYAQITSPPPSYLRVTSLDSASEQHHRHHHHHQCVVGITLRWQLYSHSHWLVSNSQCNEQRLCLRQTEQHRCTG